MTAKRAKINLQGATNYICSLKPVYLQLTIFIHVCSSFVRGILIKNRAKRRKTTLMILEYGPVENAYIDHWDCFHRRF